MKCDYLPQDSNTLTFGNQHPGQPAQFCCYVIVSFCHHGTIKKYHCEIIYRAKKCQLFSFCATVVGRQHVKHFHILSRGFKFRVCLVPESSFTRCTLTFNKNSRCGYPITKYIYANNPRKLTGCQSTTHIVQIAFWPKQAGLVWTFFNRIIVEVRLSFSKKKFSSFRREGNLKLK